MLASRQNPELSLDSHVITVSPSHDCVEHGALHSAMKSNQNLYTCCHFNKSKADGVHLQRQNVCHSPT